MSVRQVLDGSDFALLIQAGYERLKANVHVVNSLNIFPVPDGDTGTNMELSLASGVKSLQKLSRPSLYDAAQALTSGLLMGARGNSGVILSQLFRGFLKVAAKHDELNAHTFALALNEGVQIAYKAVAKPVEGTILTVAKDAAQAGIKSAKLVASLSEWMDVVLSAAKKSLSRTPEQLPVLKQAGVVDSGGQGYVFILEGFSAWLNGQMDFGGEETPPQILHTPKTNLDFAAAHIHHEGEYGYCTEVLLRTAGDVPVDDVEGHLRKKLSEYGDSLLVVAADRLVKVHVHTLHPGRVLEDALSFGTLTKIKIENMTEQHSEIVQSHEPGDVSGNSNWRSKSMDLDAESRNMPVNGTVDVDDAPGSAVSRAGDVLRPVAVVAVAAGQGLSQIFTSLGVDAVIEGGQTMNPSTEEIVDAIRAAKSEHTIVLPNNKNIVMAAEQARHVLGESVHVVKSTTIPEGIAAMMAYRPNASVLDNVSRMNASIQDVCAGQVVRAVRDSVYQNREIRANQFLGFVNHNLVEVADDRTAAAISVIQSMIHDDAELLTVFYGSDIDEQEIEQFSTLVLREFGLEVEAKFGGQPIYDYIFTLE
jgi:DAK2 domain fusion protein YloV